MKHLIALLAVIGLGVFTIGCRQGDEGTDGGAMAPSGDGAITNDETATEGDAAAAASEEADADKKEE